MSSSLSALRTVLAVKIALTLALWAGPLLLAPAESFPALGIPSPPTDLMVVVRLLGVAYLALVAVYAWTYRDPGARRGGVVAGVVSNAGASAVLFFYLGTGRLAGWPALGRVLMGASAVVTLLLAAFLVVTGWSVLRRGP